MKLLTELEEVARDRWMEHHEGCDMCRFVEHFADTDLLCHKGRALVGTWLLSLLHLREAAA